MKKTTIISLLLAQVAFAATAGAVQLFDFDAQAILPGAPGGTAEVYGVIVNGEAVATPIPLDFGGFEYTLVITGLTLDSDGLTSSFSGGSVAIYEDAATAADWAATGTFSDGTAILTGTLGTFQHTLFTSTLGTGHGYVDWTGGLRLDDLAPADQSGWPLLTGISRASGNVEPGYTERWDGKVEPTDEVVATEDATWAGVKALYR